MSSPELAQYAAFYADMTRRFGLTDSRELLMTALASPARATRCWPRRATNLT